MTGMFYAVGVARWARCGVLTCCLLSLAAGCRSLPESRQGVTAVPREMGDDSLSRIVLTDRSGRQRIVLDAEEGIQMFRADGRLALTLYENEHEVMIKCGRGKFIETPDGEIWSPNRQVIMGVVNQYGFLKIAGDAGYSRFSADGVLTEKMKR